MIEKKLIKKMVEHIFHPHKKEFVDNNLMHPEREWSIGLLIGMVLVLMGGWWSVYSYMQYNEVSIENVDSVAPDSFVYRASVVEEVLKNFSERKKNYDSLLPKSEDLNQSLVATTTQSTSSPEVLPTDRSTEIIPAMPQSDPFLEESATKTETSPSEEATTTVPVTLE